MPELQRPGELIGVYDPHAPNCILPASTKVLMEIIDVLQRERDTYRAYAGAVLKTAPLKRSLAIEHGMLEPYVIQRSDPVIPEGKQPGDTAYRFTPLGIAALESV